MPGPGAERMQWTSLGDASLRGGPWKPRYLALFLPGDDKVVLGGKASTGTANEFCGHFHHQAYVCWGFPSSIPF